MESRAASAPWPLEPGETLLWEGTASPWPPRFPWGNILFWTFAIVIVMRECSFLRMLGAFSFVFVVQALFFLRTRRILARLRFAVTDRRVLCENAGRIAETVPREGIDFLLPVTLATAASIACYARPSAPSDSPTPAIVLGLLHPGDAPAACDALRRMLGRPPIPDAPPEHVFPAWMTPKIRRDIETAFSLDGERLLWAGRPVWRLIPWHFLPFALGLGILAVPFLSLPGMKLANAIAASLLAEAQGAVQRLSTGPLGIVAGLRALLWMPVPWLFFLGLALFPFLHAALRRRSLFLVTTHRVAHLRSRWLGKSTGQPRCVLPAPRVVPRGKRRADIVFDIRPPLAFRDLPAGDVPAVLAALGLPLPSGKIP